MGVVLLGGLFEPGTSVSLFRAADGVLRSNGEGLTGRRLADSAGSVGFDGLTVGDRFIARGVDVYGHPVELRSTAVEHANDVAQPPIRPVLNGPVGTAERRPVVPAPGEPSAILQTGVPAASAA